MRKFKGVVRTNKVGSGCEFEFETEDEATPEQIEEDARDAAFQHIEWHYDETA
jgi:hypothetical protein